MKARFTIFVLVIVVLAGLAGGYLWTRGKSQPTIEPTPTMTASPTPTTTALPETAAILMEEGKVQLTHEQKDSIVEDQAEVYVGDKIKTFANSKATLIFPDNDVMRLDNDTEITILALVSSDTEAKVRVNLSSGNAWSRVESLLDKKREYSVETSTLVATVRGTVFNVDATNEEESWVGVTESAVDVERKEDKQLMMLATGNFTSVKKSLRGKLAKMLEEKMDDKQLNSSWFKDNNTKDQRIRDFLTKINKKKMEKNFLRNNWKMFFERIQQAKINGVLPTAVVIPSTVLPITGVVFDPKVALREILASLVIDKEITPEEANGVISDPYVHEQIMPMTTKDQIAVFVTDYFEKMRSQTPIATASPEPTPTPTPTIEPTPTYNPNYYPPLR